MQGRKALGLKGFMLVMRWAGLRIIDVATAAPDYLDWSACVRTAAPVRPEGAG
jgi:hypothetical protein